MTDASDDDGDGLIAALLGADPDVPMVAAGERYVVIYAVSYDHDDKPSRTGDEVRSARDAAHFALELTRDKGSVESKWRVYDSVTEKWSTFDQSEIERR